MFDLDLVKEIYSKLPTRLDNARKVLGRPLTYAEKILYTHLFNKEEVKNFKRASDYVDFAPDRVAMQDATAQMALLQFINSGKASTAVPSTVHCDHLIQAQVNGLKDLSVAKNINKEVYDFSGVGFE